MASPTPLDLFLPPVREWFRAVLGEPTPAQRLGWPAIAAGQNTLILAPTGSGKTLAAFLACLDGTLAAGPVAARRAGPLHLAAEGAQQRHPPQPAGAARRRRRDRPRRWACRCPRSKSAVRTGDTPTAERQRLVRRPPHVLITTPESLHLLLTSRARETLRGVTHCIVDEIHALCPNKRGVFLALLLERLEALNAAAASSASACRRRSGRWTRSPATSAAARRRRRPARAAAGDDRRRRPAQGPRPAASSAPSSSSARCRSRSIWPSIYRLLGDADPRSIARRSSSPTTAARSSGSRRSSTKTGTATDDGSVRSAPITAASSWRCGSRPKQALKEGRLPAVVATASLELGIDMGAVDLVCQVESPGNVARGLQRVGRAGHLVGQTEQGPAHPQDAGRPARAGGAGARDGRRPGRGDPRADQLPRRAGPAGRRHGGDGRLGRADDLYRPGPPGLSLSRPDAAGVRGGAGDGQRAAIAFAVPETSRRVAGRRSRRPR